MLYLKIEQQRLFGIFLGQSCYYHDYLLSILFSEHDLLLNARHNPY